MMQQKSGTALIRCDGGTPRLRRVAALGRALRDLEGMEVHFALGSAVPAAISGADFFGHAVATEAEFAALVRRRKPDLLILDSGANVSRAEAESLRGDCLLMAALEEEGELRLACDFAYYPPLPTARALRWAGARTVPRIGWPWLLPGAQPIQAFSSRPALLVALDDSGLTERAARALAPLESPFRIRFAIGAGMARARALAAGIVAMKRNFETVEGAGDFSTEYAAAELALCTPQNAGELAGFGVPAIYLCGSRAEEDNAKAFEEAGMGISAGLAENCSDGEILGLVKDLMNDSVRRRHLRQTAMARLEGGGAARIAADLAGAIREEKLPIRVAL